MNVCIYGKNSNSIRLSKLWHWQKHCGYFSELINKSHHFLLQHFFRIWEDLTKNPYFIDSHFITKTFSKLDAEVRQQRSLPGYPCKKKRDMKTKNPQMYWIQIHTKYSKQPNCHSLNESFFKQLARNVLCVGACR